MSQHKQLNLQQSKLRRNVHNRIRLVSVVVTLYLVTVKIRLQKHSNVIISLGVCNQTELYQELEID
jgi:hypothetical protein